MPPPPDPEHPEKKKENVTKTQKNMIDVEVRPPSHTLSLFLSLTLSLSDTLYPPSIPPSIPLSHTLSLPQQKAGAWALEPFGAGVLSAGTGKGSRGWLLLYHSQA